MKAENFTGKARQAENPAATRAFFLPKQRAVVNDGVNLTKSVEPDFLPRPIGLAR